MPDFSWLKTIVAAVTVMAAVCLVAAEKNSLPSLPPDSAVIAGAEFNALCGDPQGALVLSALQEMSEFPLEKLERAVVACDRNWRKWTLFFRAAENSDLDKLCSLLPPVPAAENAGEQRFPVYRFSGKEQDKKFSYLMRTNLQEAVVIYPVHLHRKAISRKEQKMLNTVRKILPIRNTAVIWGAGIVDSKNYVLGKLRSFDFVLEKNLQGKLQFHGKFVCKDASDASLMAFLLKSAFPAAMKHKFGIPVEKSEAALQALTISRKENMIYFSTENVEPVLQMLVPLFKNSLPFKPEIQR